MMNHRKRGLAKLTMQVSREARSPMQAALEEDEGGGGRR